MVSALEAHWRFRRKSPVWETRTRKSCVVQTQAWKLRNWVCNQKLVQSEISDSTTPCLCCHGLHYDLCHGCYFCCSLTGNPSRKTDLHPFLGWGQKSPMIWFFGGGPCLGAQQRERKRQLELWFWLRPPINHWGDIEVMKTPRDRAPRKETPIYEKISSKETLNGDWRIPQQGCLFSSRPDPMNHANFWKC